MTFIFKDYEHLHNGIQVELRVHMIGPLAEMVANFIYDSTFAKHFVNYLSSTPKIQFGENFICIHPIWNGWTSMSMNNFCYNDRAIYLYRRLVGERCGCECLTIVANLCAKTHKIACDYLLNTLWSDIIEYGKKTNLPPTLL